MNYYLMIGLGVYLAYYSVDIEKPHRDLTFLGYIVAFLWTLFLWPLALIANTSISLKNRKEIEAGQRLFDELMKQVNAHSETPPESETTAKEEDNPPSE